MASVSADSELMTNFIAAVPVPAGAKFSVVLDENRRPMVLALSNDKVPKLQLIRTGSDGNKVLIHLAANLGIKDSDGVQSFGIAQANDLRLFLTVAYGTDPLASSLLVTKAFRPEDLKADYKFEFLPGPKTNVGRVESIYITPVKNIKPEDYPSVYVFHKSLDQTKSWGPDITELYTKSLQEGWTASNRMANPENVDAILDVAPAANSFGKGLFVLYQTDNKVKLYARFIGPDVNNPSQTSTMATSVWCPPNATNIATIWTPGNRSALLIASPEGLRYLSPSESVSKKQGGIVIDCKGEKAMLQKIAQLHITQDGTQASVWFRTSSGELCYLRAPADKLAGGSATRLLETKSTTSFAACVAQPDAGNGKEIWQTLISNDDHGNLTVLEQALDTGIWRQKPFYAPSKTENMAVESYTITFHAKDEKNKPVRNGKVYITGSSSVSVIYNGRNTILPSAGAWFDTDNTGALNFIVASQTLASQAFNISKVQKSDGGALEISPFTFNPATKAMNKLQKKMENIKTADDFRAARTEKGDSLFGSSGPSNDDLKGSIEALKNIKEAYKDMPADGSKQTKSQGIMSTTEDDTVHAEGLGDVFWETWEWVKRQAKNAVDWVVEKVGDAWKFVCKIAGELVSFVLDCLEKVGEALTWVFNKLKAAWNKLIDWIGFIFSWDDILECKNTISTLVNCGLDLGVSKVSSIAVKVDQMFENMEKSVDQLMTVPKPIAKLSDSSASEADKKKDVSNTTESTSFNWAGERLKNGGAGSSTSVRTSQGNGDEETVTWSTVFQPTLDGIKDAVKRTVDDIKNLFNKDGEITAEDFMKIGKGLIISAIKTIRGLVASLLKLVKMILQKVKKYGNETIDIPIFGALYKWIANHDLTVFDAISLIIAIPTTIFTKIITGKKPPTFQEMTGNKLGKILLGPEAGEADVTAQEKLDFKIFTAGVVVSGGMVKTIYYVIKLLYKSITGGVGAGQKVLAGSGGFLELFSIIIDMLGVMHALPDQAGLPGEKFRQWISGICLIRGAVHLLALYADTSEAADIALLVFDLLSGLTVFGLEMAVYKEEMDAKDTWKGYDDDTNTMDMISSGLNALATIGYFAAFIMKRDPSSAAIGMVILQVGTVGKTVIDGVVFKKSFDDGKAALLMPSTC